MTDLFSEAAGRRLDASAPLAQRLRPTDARRLRRPGARDRARAGRCGSRSSRTACPSMVLFGPPGSGKTTLARIVAQTTGAEFEELSAVSATVANVRQVLARRARAARRERAADDPLPRRDPPLQQGAAGRAAARRRGGAADADRSDDREPVLRGQLGAALAHADLRARAALRRDAARSRAARRRRARRRPCPRRSRS